MTIVDNSTPDGEKRLTYKDGEWRMTYHTSNEYTLEQTITMYGSEWRVVAIQAPKVGNVYTYSLVELNKDT